MEFKGNEGLTELKVSYIQDDKPGRTGKGPDIR